MKKILYTLLCIFMLVGCTHQTGGNTGTSSTTTSNTDPVVTTTPKEDFRVSLGFRFYRCNTTIADFFKDDDKSELQIVLNPDGNYPNLNFAMGNNKTTYYGEFERVKDNIFSVEFGHLTEKHIKPIDNLKFKDGPELFFRLEEDKLFFAMDNLSIQDPSIYNRNACTLD